MEAWIIWLIVIIVLTIIELITINLITIWFVASGIISLLISIYSHNLNIEFTVFVTGGILLFFLTRPLVKKYYNNSNIDTNVERIIGQVGLVTEDISDDCYGSVKIDGKEWTAYSDKKIQKGKKVKIVKIKGVKVEVKEMI